MCGTAQFSVNGVLEYQGEMRRLRVQAGKGQTSANRNLSVESPHLTYLGGSPFPQGS